MQVRTSVLCSSVLIVSCATPNPEAGAPSSLAPAYRERFDFRLPEPGLELAGEPASTFAPEAWQAPPGDTSVSAFDILLGRRTLKDGYWSNLDLDQQDTFGIQYAVQAPSAAIGFETGLLFARADSSLDISGSSVDFDMTTLELFAGAHRTFGDSNWKVRPYLGGGLSLVSVSIDLSGPGGFATVEDSSPGIYLHGGAAWQVGPSFRVGADVRVLTGTDFDGVDCDYNQLALFIGFGH